MRVLFSQSSHRTSSRFLFALLLASLISGCASIDVGGPKAAKDDPAAGTLTLPDGSQHKILPQEFSYTGKATYTYPNGRKLTGTFTHGLLHGRGSEDTDTHQYVGQWRAGTKQGEGKLTQTNGTTYEGQFQNNLPHGKGKEVSSRGEYVGEFTGGHYNGEGRFTYSSTSYYEGQWQGGLRQGFGQLVSANGSRYSGEWLNDKEHGFGQRLNADGSHYEGAWAKGHYEGYGRYEDPRGIVFEGIWQAGELHGYGAQINPDGSRYEGEWAAGKRHGTGTLHRRDGSSHAGNWSEDYILGPGQRTTPTGVEISGVWNQDFIANGMIRFPTGPSYAGPLFRDKGSVVADGFLNWLQQPEPQQDPNVQLFLASVYRDFKTPEPDPASSRIWLERAAGAGIAQAQFELGVSLIEENAPLALELIQEAASSDHSGAAQQLGQYYHVGLHVPQDHNRAIKLYEIAAEQGNLTATNNLAWLLATTPDDTLADPRRAVTLIEPLVMFLGHWQHIDTLAAALARLGHFERAYRLQEMALKGSADHANATVTDEMQERLALYGANAYFTDK